MKKMSTPLRNEILKGAKLTNRKKKMQTPLRKAIQSGTSLRETKKKMQTPLKKAIQEGVTLNETKKKMQTPLKKAIQEGVTLNETKKKIQTPLKKEIHCGITLRKTKTAFRDEIQIKSNAYVKDPEKLLEDFAKEHDEIIESKSTTRKFLKAKRRYPQLEIPVQDMRHVTLADNNLKKVSFSCCLMLFFNARKHTRFFFIRMTKFGAGSNILIIFLNCVKYRIVYRIMP